MTDFYEYRARKAEAEAYSTPGYVPLAIGILLGILMTLVIAVIFQ